MITKNNRLIGIMLTAGLILLAPLIAMQFTTEVNWTIFDFLMAGVLLFGTGLACEFVLRRIPDFKRRMIICGVIVGVLIIVWIELAVGIFGTPFAGS